MQKAENPASSIFHVTNETRSNAILLDEQGARVLELGHRDDSA